MKAEKIGDYVVVRTNIRCERRAARSLRAAGYRVYFLQFRKSSTHRRTKKRIIRRYPLTPGYLFVRMTRIDWFTLRRCDGVECVVGINGTPYTIPRSDIVRMVKDVRARKWDNVTVERVSHRKRKAELEKLFRRGRRLRAKEGTFQGLEAEISGVTAKGTIAGLLNILGRLTPVEFEPDHVEPLDIAEAA